MGLGIADPVELTVWTNLYVMCLEKLPLTIESARIAASNADILLAEWRTRACQDCKREDTGDPVQGFDPA